MKCDPIDSNSEAIRFCLQIRGDELAIPSLVRERVQQKQHGNQCHDMLHAVCRLSVLHLVRLT